MWFFKIDLLFNILFLSPTLFFRLLLSWSKFTQHQLPKARCWVEGWVSKIKKTWGYIWGNCGVRFPTAHPIPNFSSQTVLEDFFSLFFSQKEFQGFLNCGIELIGILVFFGERGHLPISKNDFHNKFSLGKKLGVYLWGGRFVVKKES